LSTSMSSSAFTPEIPSLLEPSAVNLFPDRWRLSWRAEPVGN
jgi:hypothetical protein